MSTVSLPASAPANVPSAARAQFVSTMAAAGSRPYVLTHELMVDAGSANAEVTIRCFTAVIFVSVDTEAYGKATWDIHACKTVPCAS